MDIHGKERTERADEKRDRDMKPTRVILIG